MDKATTMSISYQLDEINKKLKPKFYEIKLQHRYNTIALDLYENDELIQNLVCGCSKNEIGIYLKGFIKSYDLLL